MTTAGQIFDEEIFTVSESGAGSRDFDVDIENDGCLIFIQRTSGTANLTGTISTDGRGSTPEITLKSINITDGDVKTFAVISMRRLKISLAWDDACDAKIIVQAKSGSAVTEWEGGQDTTSDSFTTDKISVTDSGVTVVNVVGRKTISIRNNEDPLTFTGKMYVAESAAKGVDGWPLKALEGLSLDIDSGGSFYLITDTGLTVDARIIQIRRG